MKRRGRRTAIGTIVPALTSVVAGGVVAATQSSDEAALQPTRQARPRQVRRGAVK